MVNLEVSAVARLCTSGPRIDCEDSCGNTAVGGAVKLSIVVEATLVAFEDVVDRTDQTDEVPDETDNTEGVGDAGYEIAWGVATRVILIWDVLRKKVE
jgi:hypothetical protein